LRAAIWELKWPIEELPILQKGLIRKAHWHGKPAIVATQMMLSMVEKIAPNLRRSDGRRQRRD